MTEPSSRNGGFAMWHLPAAASSSLLNARAACGAGDPAPAVGCARAPPPPAGSARGAAAVGVGSA
eukprot:2445396-Pleurochrysis_carterae.AAC.1